MLGILGLKMDTSKSGEKYKRYFAVWVKNENLARGSRIGVFVSCFVKVSLSLVVSNKGGNYIVIFEEKVYFRSQILEHPSIGEYWNISCVPVLPDNVIFMFFRTSWCYSEAYNTRTQKWSSIVQHSCTRIWDLKYTFSIFDYRKHEKMLGNV